MNWYDGNISEAISEIKKHSKLLLVFVRGSDDDSKYIDNQFDCTTKELYCDIICLRIEAASQLAMQFSAVYALLTVPCIYIIKPDGKVMDVKLGRLSMDELNVWIESQRKEFKQSIVPNESPGSSSSNKSLEDRIACAQKLIEEKRSRDEKEEIVKSSKSEINRRDVGKSLQEFKAKQKEKEVELMLAERRKEEEDNARLKKQLLDQIAQDRKEQELKRRQIQQQQQSSEPMVCRLKDKNSIRIQIRLFNEDSRFVHSFQPSSTIKTDVRDWLKKLSSNSDPTDPDQFGITESDRRNLRKVVQCGYRFHHLHPSRILDEQSENKTLSELGFSPSACLFIVPSDSSWTVVPNSNTIGRVFLYINNMMYSTWDILGRTMNFIFSLGRNFLSSSTTSNTPQVNAERANHYSAQNSAEQENPQAVSDTSVKRNRQAGVRRQGNVARLSHMPEDSDDEEARWNGNSTQQL